MTTAEVLGLLAGTLVIASIYPYVAAIGREETIPAQSTWTVWTLLNLITVLAMWQAGTISLMIGIALAGDMLILTLAFIHGKRTWSLLDKFCLGGAVLGICLWWMTNNPLTGIVISLLVMTLGSIPTFIKTWRRPHEENAASYMFMMSSCAVQLLAVPEWSAEHVLQPIAWFINGAVIVSLTFMREKHRHWVKIMTIIIGGTILLILMIIQEEVERLYRRLRTHPST